MPSSVKYKRERKKHYKHEEMRRQKLHGTKSDPKASRVKVERQRLRKKLGLKKGDKATAGHTGGGKLSKKRLGKKPLSGKIQSAKSNYASGGRLVKGKSKAVSHGKNRKKSV